MGPANTGTPKKPKGLLGYTSTVGLITLCSRVLGLLRDILIAQSFGAGTHADACFVAFKVPNFLRRLFGEGAFAQAFVPVLAEYKANHPKDSLKYFTDRVFGLLGGSTLLISALAVMGAPLIIFIFAPGFAAIDAKMQIATDMLRLTFPYLFFISLVAAASSILNTYQAFAPGAFAPVLLNLCLIFAALFASNSMDEPIMALAGGVLVAGLLQLLLMLVFLKKIQLLPRPVWDTKHPGIKQILKLMAPAMLGVSVSQVNLLLDTILASFLPEGSVSWLYYSERLLELPLGVAGIAIATVILPQLSNKQAQSDTKGFNATLDWGVRLVLLVGMPACLGLFILAEPILTTLFAYGQFTESDVIAAASSLRAYALGLVPIMLVKVLAPGFYAQQDMKTPVKIAVIAMSTNMVFNLILVWPLAHSGLALATALSALVNVVLLHRGLHKSGIYQSKKNLLAYLMKLCIGASGMVGFLLWLAPGPTQWFDWSLELRLLMLSTLVIFGACIYLGLLRLLGIRLNTFKGP